jgi:hypothetical protein
MKNTSELMLKNEVTDVNSPWDTHLPLELNMNNLNSGDLGCGGGGGGVVAVVVVVVVVVVYFCFIHSWLILSVLIKKSAASTKRDSRVNLLGVTQLPKANVPSKIAGRAGRQASSMPNDFFWMVFFLALLLLLVLLLLLLLLLFGWF